jgi:hypothetical protein
MTSTWRIVAVVGILMATLAGVAGAQNNENALLELLIRKGTISRAEADEVQAQWDKQIATQVAQYQKIKVASWRDRLSFAGSLTLRGENIDFEPGLGSSRSRFLAQLRLGIEATLGDWVIIGAGLSTGGESPVSGYQTLQDTFSKKEIRLDLAYAVIQPPSWDWLKVTGGKMRQIVWQPDHGAALQYDTDARPEGVAEQFAWRFGDRQQFSFFANFGQFVLEEVERNQGDQYLLEQQLGASAQWPALKLIGAIGYTQTLNLDELGVRGGGNTRAASTSPNLGNATRVTGTATNYLADFEVVSLRAEAAWQFRQGPLLGTPGRLTLSGEYMRNLASAYDSLAGSTESASPDQRTGWTVQLALGESRTKGQWRLSYQYMRLEADAVWDALADSNWGTGGTDREGHVVKATYQVQDWWQLMFRVFVTEKISDRPNTRHNLLGTAGESMVRWHLDSQWKF